MTVPTRLARGPAPRPRRAPTNPLIPMAMMAGAMTLVGAGVVAGHIHRQKPVAAAVSTTTTTVLETIKGSVLAPKAAPGCASAPNGIQQGAAVHVVDPTGAVLGSTTLQRGLPANGGGCTWSWLVQVPLVNGYQIQVGGLPVASATKSQLANTAWNFYENDTTNTQNLINIESGV